MSLFPFECSINISMEKRKKVKKKKSVKNVFVSLWMFYKYINDSSKCTFLFWPWAGLRAWHIWTCIKMTFFSFCLFFHTSEALGGFTRLTHLDLYQNDFFLLLFFFLNTAEALGGLTRLTHLDLYQNDFSSGQLIFKSHPRPSV